MFEGTIRSLAEKLEVEYAVAQGLMKFLSTKKIASDVGVEKPKNGNGKGATIWKVPFPITIKLGE